MDIETLNTDTDATHHGTLPPHEPSNPQGGFRSDGHSDRALRSSLETEEAGLTDYVQKLIALRQSGYDGPMEGMKIYAWLVGLRRGNLQCTMDGCEGSDYMLMISPLPPYYSDWELGTTKAFKGRNIDELWMDAAVWMLPLLRMERQELAMPGKRLLERVFWHPERIDNLTFALQRERFIGKEQRWDVHRDATDVLQPSGCAQDKPSPCPPSAGQGGVITDAVRESFDKAIRERQSKYASGMPVPYGRVPIDDDHPFLRKSKFARVISVTIEKDPSGCAQDKPSPCPPSAGEEDDMIKCISNIWPLPPSLKKISDEFHERMRRVLARLQERKDGMTATKECAG